LPTSFLDKVVAKLRNLLVCCDPIVVAGTEH
jgi:hypothetical protein